MRAGLRGAGSKAGVCELLLQDSRKFDGDEGRPYVYLLLLIALVCAFLVPVVGHMR